MYKDVIHYQLAENVSIERLLEVARKVAEDWMKKQAGFVRWKIHTHTDGTFTDIVYWTSAKDAKNAEKEMDKLPNANEWYSCYKKDSISSEKLTEIASF